MLSHLITAAVSSSAGALLRQPQIDRLTRDLSAAYRRINNLVLQLNQANGTIQDQAKELNRRSRSEALKDAEIARLMELIPPTDASE